MTEYQDRRMKSIIFTMASSGIRLGAWDYLRWKDIEPISKNGRVVAAKITVYAGEEDEYFSFVTPEAFHELEKWICYRKEAGEIIDKNSWVMRQLWNTKEGYYHGIVTEPIKLKSSGIKRLIERNHSNKNIKIVEKLSIGVFVLSVGLITVSMWLITATFLIIGITAR